VRVCLPLRLLVGLAVDVWMARVRQIFVEDPVALQNRLWLSLCLWLWLGRFLDHRRRPVHLFLLLRLRR
jgi:hypothetical protein